jgi:hypothetical protein
MRYFSTTVRTDKEILAFGEKQNELKAQLDRKILQCDLDGNGKKAWERRNVFNALCASVQRQSRWSVHKRC